MAAELDKIFSRSRSHLIYAVISVACPFIAALIISIYQERAYAEFWQPKPLPLDDADINAGAMMAIVIVVQIFLAIAIGSVIGLIFAGLSLWKRFRFVSFGTAALLFNAVPIIFFLYKFFTGW